jgi:integrase
MGVHRADHPTNRAFLTRFGGPNNEGVRANAMGNREKEEISPDSQKAYLHIFHLLKKAIEWGMLDENPFTRFKESPFFEEKNDRVRFLGEHEIKTLLDVSPPYLANLIKGAIFTGLRNGDLLNLKMGI